MLLKLQDMMCLLLKATRQQTNRKLSFIGIVALQKQGDFFVCVLNVLVSGGQLFEICKLSFLMG